MYQYIIQDIFIMYKTGGLEPTTDELETLDVDGIKYVVSDKFKTMLRDSFIDWGTFLEIYGKNLNYVDLFDQMIKILNIKENENLRDFMIPLVKKIYELPAKDHMACMLKQFMIYEPVSYAIHSLFTVIKLHYEKIVYQYILARNKYILLNKINDKTNDLEELRSYWDSLNEQYSLDSSSTTLLFLNPPKGMKNNLYLTIKGVDLTLSDVIKKFKYAGFCPKVPYERLKSLLEFPINEFVAVIKQLDPDAKFPNYTNMERIIADMLKEMPKKPEVPDDIIREKAPQGLDKLSLAKWYVDAILDLRKKLLKYGALYEEYYTNQAKILIRVTDVIKRDFL